MFISVLRYASGPRVQLAGCKSALNSPVVNSTVRSKAVVLVLVLLFDALRLILRGDLFYLLHCVIFFLCLVLLALRLRRLGKSVILALFVCLFDLRLFGFVSFSSFWCLGIAAACDCDTPWILLLSFLNILYFLDHTDVF